MFLELLEVPSMSIWIVLRKTGIFFFKYNVKNCLYYNTTFSPDIDFLFSKTDLFELSNKFKKLYFFHFSDKFT